MIGRYIIATAALGSLLAACTSPQQQRRAQQSRMAERVLDRAGSIGDPGRVAAADISFARQARDEGQWTAFRATAAPGAVVHGENGTVPVETFIAGRANPPVSNAWTPNTIWTSCDGTLAVTFGRYQVPSGDVGSYVTVWQLQRDRSYKWAYNVRMLDDPQPEPEAGPDIPEGENAIIVPGMTSIEGRIADCPQQGGTVPQSPLNISMPAPTARGRYDADDGTLDIVWEQYEAGTRTAAVQWFRDGEWQVASVFTVPQGAE